MADHKVATAQAEIEFERFVEAMDLDFNPAGWDADDRKSFDDAKRRVLRAIESGQLVVDEKGQPVFTPRVGNTEPITFQEQTGASLMAMDQKRKGHDVAKMFSVMADMTGTSVQRFADMAGRDLKVCQAITALFLA